MFKRFAALGVLLACAMPSATATASGTDPLAGIPSTYKDFDQFPMCSATVTTFCISSWGVDLDGSGTYKPLPASSGIIFTAWLSSIATYNAPSLTFGLFRTEGNHRNEVYPEIPAGTPLQYSINTGAFHPSPSLFSWGQISQFDVAQINGNWMTTGSARTQWLPIDIGCEIDCLHLKSRYEYKSQFYGGLSYEEPNALLDSKRGMWVETDASISESLFFNEDLMTWSINLYGPPTRIDGSPNFAHYNTFLPDTFIRYAYGTTPDLLINSLVATRTDGTSTTAVGSTITRVPGPIPGILISIPNIKMYGGPVSGQSLGRAPSAYSTHPKLKIAPKYSLLRAPTIRSAVRVSASKAKVTGYTVPGARSYQAMCSRGADTKNMTSKTPSFTVSGLTPGKWKCAIRGVQKLGGRWSRSLTVTIK
jgi:hypothetical protein